MEFSGESVLFDTPYEQARVLCTPDGFLLRVVNYDTGDTVEEFPATRATLATRAEALRAEWWGGDCMKDWTERAVAWALAQPVA